MDLDIDLSSDVTHTLVQLTTQYIARILHKVLCCGWGGPIFVTLQCRQISIMESQITGNSIACSTICSSGHRQKNFNGCLMGYPVDIGWYNGITQGLYPISCKSPLITRFMEPIWSPSGAERTQVGSMLAPWTLLCYVIANFSKSRIHEFWC